MGPILIRSDSMIVAHHFALQLALPTKRMESYNETILLEGLKLDIADWWIMLGRVTRMARWWMCNSIVPCFV